MNHVRFNLVLIATILVIGCSKPQTVESQLEQAKQFQQKGDYRSSAIVLKSLLQNNPRHGEARYLLGFAFKQNGQPVAAETNLRIAQEAKYDPPKVLLLLAQALFDQAAFDKVVEATHSSDHGEAALQPEVLALRGHAQLSLGRTADGAISFDEALKRNPNHALALLGQARVSLDKAQLPNAIALVDRALTADPSSLYAWLMKGDLSRATGKADVAMSAYQKALALSPDGFAPNINVASLHLAEGKLDLAQKHIDTILRIAPQSPVGYYLLGLLKLRGKDYTAADAAVQQLSKLAPNYLPGAALAGVLAYSRGSDRVAAQRLGEAFVKSPESIPLRKLYAAALIKVNKAQQAVEILNPAIQAAPNDSSLLTLYAEAKFQLKDLTAARRYFELAVQQNPKDPRGRTGLGMTRLAAGETERALSDLETAVELGGGAADTLLATSLMSIKQYDRALEAIGRLEAKRSTDPVVFNLKGAALFAKGDVAGARKAFERAVELQPGQFAASMNLAQLDTRENNPAEARKRFEKVLETDKNNVSAMLAIADLALASNNSSEAITWAERARQVQPDGFAPAMTLAKLYFEKSDFQQAMNAARQALRSKPDDADGLNILGYCQLRLGQNLEALNTYTLLANRNPKSAPAHYGLSNAQVANGKLTAAQISLQKAIELRPDFSEAIYALAALHLRTGKTSEVNKLVNDAQKRVPRSVTGFVLAGDAAMAEKRFDQAARAYENAFAMEASHVLLVKLHSALRNSGRAAAAETLAVTWLKKNPDDLQVRYLVANVAIANQDYQRAAEQFQYALKKEPTKLTLLHNLAWVYERMNDRRALDVAQTAYKLAPDSPAVLHNFGRLHVEMGDPALALPALEKARALAPASHIVRFHLAIAYTKTGSNARAREELQQLLRGNEEFTERADAVALLKRLTK